MNHISTELLKIAFQLEQAEENNLCLDFAQDKEISYQEIMIQEVLGSPIGAYLSEVTNDQEAVREIILAGATIGRLLSVD